MLEVLELRSGELEFLDTVRHRTRKNYYTLSRILFNLLKIMVIIFLGLIVARIIIPEFEITAYLIILAFLMLLSFIIQKYLVKHFLLSSLSSFVLLIDEGNVVTSIKVQDWVEAKINEYSQYDIRYNQAVGFKCFIMDDGSIMVEIIVDENYPGQRMFNAMNMDTVVDFKRSMNVIFPDKLEWYFVLEDGGQWDEADLKEFNDEMRHARTPIVLRNYFKI